MAQPLGAAAAVPIAQQQLLGGGAPFHERRLEPLRERGAQLALVPGVQLAELVEVGRQRIGVEQVGGRALGLVGGREHGLWG